MLEHMFESLAGSGHAASTQADGCRGIPAR
jgi:hypothetical protein